MGLNRISWKLNDSLSGSVIFSTLPMGLNRISWKRKVVFFGTIQTAKTPTDGFKSD